MPVGTAFIRIFFTLLLSLPLMLAGTYYLVVSSAENVLLNPDFVSNSLRNSGYYDGVYSEVLLRSEFEPWSDSFIGGFEASDEDRAQLLEEIASKTYLQRETDRNISSLVKYLDGSQDDLDLYIDLETPLRNSPPVTSAFVVRKIQGLDTVVVSSPERLTSEIGVYLQSLSSGRFPEYLPSSEDISVEQKVQSYQEAFAALDPSGSASRSALDELHKTEAEAIQFIKASHLEEALELSGRSVARGRALSAQAFVLERSDPQRRLHLVEQIAENSDLTNQRILNDSRLLRSLLQAAFSPVAQWIALVTAVLCLLGIALLFVPYWKHMVFWPSLILLVSGSLLLVLALSTTVDTAYWTSVLCQEMDLERCTFTLGVAQELAAGIGSGVADSALKIILAGSIGLILTLVVSRIVPQRTP